MPAATDNRDRVRSFRMDLDNLEAVTESPEHRQPESVGEHEAGGTSPDHGPGEPRERVPHERWAKRDRVSKARARARGT